MNFNRHSKIEGQHAFLGASNYHWVNYDKEKLCEVFYAFSAAKRGSELHDLACRCIKLGVKLPRSQKTLNMYVNDAIGYRLDPEVMLYFSSNCFGTADAIGFRNGLLRIHDLKTGKGRVSMTQLDIYTALFCLEYDEDPRDIEIQNRIYQNDEVLTREPPPDDILYIMDKIIDFDMTIERLKMEG